MPDPATADNSNFATIASTDEVSCGVKADGKIFCWALPTTMITLPVPAEADNADFVNVSVLYDTGTDPDYNYACGVKRDGQVSCWGTQGFITPPSGGGFIRVGTGTFMACAIKEDGKVACWGPDVRCPPPELSDGSCTTSRRAGAVDAATPDLWEWKAWDQKASSSSAIASRSAWVYEPRERKSYSV